MVDMQRAARTLRRGQQRHMKSTVRIESVVQGGFDESTGEYTEETTLHYDGAALIRPEPDRLFEVEAGDGQAGITLYRVVVEHGADVPRDARVTVTDSPDAVLVGRALWVFDFDLSDWQVNRVLVCREAR